MPVSDEVRKDNSIWVKRRNDWRNRYKALSSEIAFFKSDIRNADRFGNVTLARQMRVSLGILQNAAREMMLDREYVISGMLRATAYRYEDME